MALDVPPVGEVGRAESALELAPVPHRVFVWIFVAIFHCRDWLSTSPLLKRLLFLFKGCLTSIVLKLGDYKLTR